MEKIKNALLLTGGLIIIIPILLFGFVLVVIESVEIAYVLIKSKIQNK